ncbi:MAG: MFS transporter [Pirellulales bacterium]
MLSEILASFQPRNQPWMVRSNYAHELVTASTFSIAVAMVESGVIGVLAKKTFHVSELELATIMAAPMFANLTSFIWAMLARGKHKVPFLTMLQVSVLLFLGVISILPTVGYGPALLVAVVILIRCALAGAVTLRSTVWRMNYPKRKRAQITSRFTLVASLIIALGPLVGFVIQDISPNSFRILYRVAALIGLIGVIAFSRIRVRKEKQLLQFERQPTARTKPHGTPDPIEEFESDQRHSVWTVLRKDHDYRWYLIWQFFGGMANLIGNFALIRLVIELTDGMDYEYGISILITTTIPLLFAMFTISVWARYLDRVHVARFRTRQGLFWIISQLGNWGAAISGLVGLFAIPRMIDGVSRGGGMLAWNLGHNDFANRHMVPLYMGIHVTLTGVRGLFAPYLAMIMLYGWKPDAVPGLTLPPFAGIGPHVFLLTTALAMVAEAGFIRLSRDIKRKQANTSKGE